MKGPCPKCGSTERASNGSCRPCKRERDRKRARERRLRARQQYAEHTDAERAGAPDVPPGYMIKGTSVLRDAVTGEARLIWEKTAQDKDAKLQLLLAAAESVGEKMPREPLISPPQAADLDEDLLSVYPMGDPHVGLYAWAEETGGADFDLGIVESVTCEAVDRLVALAPHAATAILLNLGDFFHSDTAENRTARSGHALDVDTRWARVMQVGIRIFCRAIDRALEKHERVHVRCDIGNHDDHSAVMLALVLDHHYADNPRVQIDTSPNLFWKFRFGKCLIASTHGHMAKPKDLPAVMAADWPEDWGETEFRRWYVGHYHHEQVQEYPGCTVEVFRTLAPRDAWHAAKGYRSRRDMRVHVWHRDRGLINWHRTEPTL